MTTDEGKPFTRESRSATLGERPKAWAARAASSTHVERVNTRLADRQMLLMTPEGIA
jgi:hypothetical protein